MASIGIQELALICGCATAFLVLVGGTIALVVTLSRKKNG